MLKELEEQTLSLQKRQETISVWPGKGTGQAVWSVLS